MEPHSLIALLHSQSEQQALILLSPDGAVVDWMMGAARIFGRDRASMIGRSVHCLFTPEDQAARVPEDELETARRLGTGEDDRWMVRSDGARFWASGFVQCLRDADGKVAGFAKLLRDRTDIRGQIDAHRNRAERLAEEDRSKLMAFGTLAHELRTPLAAMLNAVQLIEQTSSHDDKLTYALGVMRRQTHYVSSLIGDLQELVRARAGKAALHYESIQMNDLLTEITDTLRATTEGKGQEVTLVLPLSPVRLEGDAVRLRQTFLNLLQNASKFSDRGKRISVTFTVEDGEAVVKFEDQGRGISASLLPRIFDALAQAEPLAQGEGFGLGLSLVKEYVELHGGTVQVRSEGLDRGSEFTVRLPLVRRIQPSSDVPSKDLPSARV